ncbi:MAG: hypothetical protein K6T66_05890 [Peptococcaceae bacterium]|nr:hypothetical protein [Peptococcaceae bacterium]
MQAVWEMTSDTKIMAMLADVDRVIDGDITRLMFIELLSRIKKLEEENLALRVLLMEENLVESNMYEAVLGLVRDFLKKKDRERAGESEFFSRSGVSFPEWVSFKLTGHFGKPHKGSGLQ